MNSLSSRTAQLPRISFDAPKGPVGKNTVDCMKSGLIYGHAGSIDGIIDRIIDCCEMCIRDRCKTRCEER